MLYGRGIKDCCGLRVGPGSAFVFYVGQLIAILSARGVLSRVNGIVRLPNQSTGSETRTSGLLTAIPSSLLLLLPTFLLSLLHKQEYRNILPH